MFFLGKEDLTRHRADNETNSAPVTVLDPDDSAFQPKTWADVKVGDIVKINSRESFPADLLFLLACEPTSAQASHRHVQSLARAPPQA